MLGVGGALSAGVFVTLGYAATLAGTALITVMALCGVINFLTMLSYAELGAAIPSAGGEYTFAKASFGGFLSFTTGWFEWISNIFYTTFSALGFAYLIAYVLPGINVPIVAMLTIAVFSIINVRGVKEMGLAQTILMIVLLSILAVFIVGGFLTSQTTSTTMDFTAPTGFFGVIRATAFIFVVYLGGEAIAGAQEEIKNPSKNIPRAIILTSIILIAIYMAVTFVIFRIVPYESLANQTSPLAYVAGQFMGPIGIGMITLAGIIAALTSVNTSIMAHSRVAYALGRDGYFPKHFTILHKRCFTPFIPILAGMLLTGTFAATAQMNFFTYATDFGFIIGFILVNLSLIRLRKTRPALFRPFKVPFYPITPILGILASLLLIFFLEPGTLLIGLSLFVLGLVVYYIRMVGYRRMSLAIAGMNMGTSIIAAFIAYLLAGTGVGLAISPSIRLILVIGAVFVSIICLLAFILNFIKNGDAHVW
jgi:amino acid transporter